ncbi:sulfatase family protein [Neorhodopirellula pilleata]|nr:sulfatase [Neorhodopirellula pilleata]
MNLFRIVLIAAWCCIPHGWAAAADRPNILFAFADDWGRHASIYAQADGPGTVNDVVSTPNFDALAKSGVLFNNAYVNAPSCTPCRSSIVSGQHFWRCRTGAILQGAVWDESIPTWPLLLQDAGYHIGFTWKVWSPGSPINAPYGGSVNAYESSGRSFNGFSQSVTKMVDQGQSLDDAKQVLLDQVRGNFRAMLADKKPEQPFAYWFGPTNVHRKWIQGSGKALWGLNPDDLKGKMPAFLPDVPEVRQDFADYLGEAMAFDMSLGVLVDELKKAGEFDNTLIAISGDHGPAGFPHGKCNLYDFGTRVSLSVSGPGVSGGRVVDDFVTLPDLAPTFLQAGDVDPPEVMTAKTLWPVLKSEDQGWVDPSRTQVYVGRERHVANARQGQLPYPQRAIRTKDYLFVMNFRPERYPLGDPYRLGDNDEASGDEPTVNEMTNNTLVTLPDEDAGPTKAWIVSNRHRSDVQPFFRNAYGKRAGEELFDLSRDPDQMNNVAGDPAYAEVVSELRNRLMSELKETGDPRLVDQGRFFETPPMAGPLPPGADAKGKAKGRDKSRPQRRSVN